MAQTVPTEYSALGSLEVAGVPTDHDLMQQLTHRGLIVELHLPPTQVVVLRRRRVLLVLGPEGTWAHLSSKAFEGVLRFAIRIEEVTNMSNVSLTLGEGIIWSRMAIAGRFRCR